MLSLFVVADEGDSQQQQEEPAIITDHDDEIERTDGPSIHPSIIRVYVDILCRALLINFAFAEGDKCALFGRCDGGMRRDGREGNKVIERERESTIETF